MSYRCSWLPAIILLSILISACQREEVVTEVNTARTELIKPHQDDAGDQIHIALGGMVTPKEGLAYYREFLAYVEKHLGRPVEYVDAEDYAEINRKLKTGELQAAFVCSGPYVDGKKEFGLEFIAAPQAYGEAVYYSYVIVPANSPAKTLDDLKGKSFAFTDPLSNSGHLVPQYTLTKKGKTPELFFGKIFYSGSHDKSIKAISEGLVDGAAVDSLIWEFKNQRHPDQTAKTRIISKSDPYAPPPFVVSPGLDPQAKKKLREILLNAHTTPEGRAILDKMMIDRFVPLDDHAYDSVREIKRWLTRKSGNKVPN